MQNFDNTCVYVMSIHETVATFPNMAHFKASLSENFDISERDVRLVDNGVYSPSYLFYAFKLTPKKESPGIGWFYAKVREFNDIVYATFSRW